jgi:epoxyqueuosine reductase
MSRPAPHTSLESLLGELGVDLYGYAAMVGVLPSEWGDWPYAVSIALALPADQMTGVWQGPTAAYYRAYEAANTRLNEICNLVEQWLLRAGYRATAFAATVSADALRDLGRDLCAPVQHKTVATRAGLGWIGKNALLITPTYGPRVRLASIFTDMPLPVARPVTVGSCGSCHRCVDSCPARALSGTTWQAGMPRADMVDAHECERVATRLLQERVRISNAVCGICIAVCPFARLSNGIKSNERAK